ncbi:MAG: hypothetical protein QE263_03440 [Vampirovibrionales bacterium]|nr:hypothetical protein [Vampirovibrionales bacterium]
MINFAGARLIIGSRTNEHRAALEAQIQKIFKEENPEHLINISGAKRDNLLLWGPEAEKFLALPKKPVYRDLATNEIINEINGAKSQNLLALAESVGIKQLDMVV